MSKIDSQFRSTTAEQDKSQPSNLLEHINVSLIIGAFDEIKALCDVADGDEVDKAKIEEVLDKHEKIIEAAPIYYFPA